MLRARWVTGRFDLSPPLGPANRSSRAGGHQFEPLISWLQLAALGSAASWRFDWWRVQYGPRDCGGFTFLRYAELMRVNWDSVAVRPHESEWSSMSRP